MAGSQVTCMKEQEVLCMYVCMSVVAIPHKPIGKTRMIQKKTETGSDPV